MASLAKVLHLKAKLMSKVLVTFRRYYRGVSYTDAALFTTEITEFSIDGWCHFNVVIGDELIAKCSMKVSESSSIVTIDYLYLNGSIYTKVDVFVEDLAVLALIKSLNMKEMFVEGAIFKFVQDRCPEYKNLKVVKNEFQSNRYCLKFDIEDMHYGISISLDLEGYYCFQGYCQDKDAVRAETVSYTSKKKSEDIKSHEDFLELLSKYYTMLQIARE